MIVIFMTPDLAKGIVCTVCDACLLDQFMATSTKSVLIYSETISATIWREGALTVQ